MLVTRRQRPVILALMGAFWPGSASSGAVSSLKALVACLADEFEFRILARDRPFGALNALAETGRWFDLGFAQVRYCAPSRFGADGLGEILRSLPHDALLLNGFFDRDFTIPALVMRRLGRVPLRPAILSPRGEFAPGALATRKTRKLAYLQFARASGLLRDVWLHATAEHEAEDVSRAFPASRGILLTPNAPRLIAFHGCPAESSPPQASLRLAFLGRIAPVKNLDYALEVLRLVTVPVEFDIIGPADDRIYWAKCEQIIASMPKRISVQRRGEIANDNVPEVLRTYDLMFLPTRGENFGHAIYEALASGVPVLISDKTIWSDLEKNGAGWSLPLDEPARFAEVIDQYSRAGRAERRRLSLGARRLAERVLAESDFVNKNRSMFQAVIRQGAL